MTTAVLQLEKTATQAEQYIKAHLFDPDGLMYSYIDVRTGKPFATDFARESRHFDAPREAWSIHLRADADPVAYWSYEDTVATAGFYMEALVLKHEATGDPAPLEQAFRIWETYKLVYYASQVYGSGSFLRPYGGLAGGFAGLGRWAEPLGTDQASPLLTAQYALWKHAADADKQELADVMVNTLAWYERQGFRYLYYKSLIHGWDKAEPYRTPHAGSYYFPALAFAAKVTHDGKWMRYFREKLPLSTGSGRELMDTFKWGSDLVMLADLLGSEFERMFAPKLLTAGGEEALRQLARFDQPGMTARGVMGPESVRTRPGEEGFHFLCGLAGLNCPGAAEPVARVLSQPTRVPEDFTVFATEDADRLPRKGYLQLQARAVGRPLVLWYRDYWRLRQASASAAAVRGPSASRERPSRAAPFKDGD